MRNEFTPWYGDDNHDAAKWHVYNLDEQTFVTKDEDHPKDDNCPACKAKVGA